MRILHVVIALASIGACALGAVPVVSALTIPADPERPGALSMRVVALDTASGRHRFTVEVADTDQSRAYGLMNRDALPAGHGMLFDFMVDRPTSFWMRNTRIPLDMVFVRADGVVANVHEGARPFDLQAIPSRGPVRYVLEVPAGEARLAGVAPGDRMDVSPGGTVR